jgi:hypothetical protein
LDSFPLKGFEQAPLMFRSGYICQFVGLRKIPEPHRVF